VIFSCVSFPPPLSLPFPKKRWQGVATLFGKLWTRRRSWRSMLLTIWQLWFRRVMRTDVFYRIKSTNFELFWTRTCPLAKEDAISRGDLYRCLFDTHTLASIICSCLTFVNKDETIPRALWTSNGITASLATYSRLSNYLIAVSQSWTLLQSIAKTLHIIIFFNLFSSIR